MTKAEELEARAPQWVTEALHLVRESFQIRGNGIDCETTARADEIEHMWTVVVAMEARVKPFNKPLQIHRTEMRLEEYDIVRFGCHPFVKERLQKMLGELARAVFECNTVFEAPRPGARPSHVE